MRQSCNKKEKKKEQIYILKGEKLGKKNRKTLKNGNKMKTYKINIFKHEAKKGNTVK